MRPSRLVASTPSPMLESVAVSMLRLVSHPEISTVAPTEMVTNESSPIRMFAPPAYQGVCKCTCRKPRNPTATVESAVAV